MRVETHAISIVGRVETIDVTARDGVVTITLNRPHKKNAIDGVMWDELLATFRELALDSTARAIVLTGANGDFSSGADLSGGGAVDAGRHQLTTMRHIGDVALALHRMPQPTIAKIRGVAVGAGLNMALGCDLVVASTNARFSEIFARRGLSIDFGGSWVLPRRVGLHRAKELALLAEIIDANEADRIGLVNRVVDDAELDAFVDDWAAKLAVGPPLALAMTKRMLNNSAHVTLEEALDDEGAAQTVNFSTKDTAEAMAAFLEKRAPRFMGR
jgi:2-(1,2-epoxy-1,2-dihydrophenyl)acetyl-CoA isomerase